MKPEEKFVVPPLVPFAGAQHHEAGQILRLAAQAVKHPGAERRAAELNAAGEQQQLPRVMVERVGVHRAHQRDVVGDRSQVRHQLGKLHAALAVGWNAERLAMTLAVGLMKASFRSLVIDGGRDWPSYFSSAGLGSNSSYWLGPPSMNMIDDVLRLGSEVRRLRGSAD